jgi:hypothetical protein
VKLLDSVLSSTFVYFSFVFVFFSGLLVFCRTQGFDATKLHEIKTTKSTKDDDEQTLSNLTDSLRVAAAGW